MSSLYYERERVAKRFLPDGIHPECREGEMWVCNIKPDDFVGWRTGRVGKVAFWEGGEKVASGLLPLFVSKEEVRDCGEHVGMCGTVFIRVEQYVPHYCSDEYTLTRISKEAIA